MKTKQSQNQQNRDVLNLRAIDHAIHIYVEQHIESAPHHAGLLRLNQYIPSHQCRMDGRTLRGLCRRGLVRLSAQNNGSRDPRYFSHWYDISLTKAGRAAIAQTPGP